MIPTHRLFLGPRDRFSIAVDFCLGCTHCCRFLNNKNNLVTGKFKDTLVIFRENNYKYDTSKTENHCEYLSSSNYCFRNLIIIQINMRSPDVQSCIHQKKTMEEYYEKQDWRSLNKQLRRNRYSRVLWLVTQATIAELSRIMIKVNFMSNVTAILPILLVCFSAFSSFHVFRCLSFIFLRVLCDNWLSSSWFYHLAVMITAWRFKTP